MSEPIPALPLEYAPPTLSRRPRWRQAVRLMLLLTWLECLVALIVIPTISVESVLVSGPVILASGTLLLIGSVLVAEPLGMIVAAGHCAICLLFFGLVNMRNWSPSDARIPFIVMGSVYVCVSLVSTLYAWRKVRIWTAQQAY